jgi:DNA helicase-2/ATP-dependent DNA helicase PcrA
MVNAGIGLSSILSRYTPGAPTMWTTFVDSSPTSPSASALNLLDYDDLLLFWRAVAESSVGRQAAREFEHILVDEYQDTNPLQAEILLALRRDTRNLMVVGDDAQAIYSFRSASVRNILDFPEHFPGARRITLEQNTVTWNIGTRRTR